MLAWGLPKVSPLDLRSRFYRQHALPVSKPIVSTHWEMFDFYTMFCVYRSSVLWHCWLNVSKSIWPVKIDWRGAVLLWLSIGSEMQMICMWFSQCHCHPIISCFLKIQNGFTFLVPAYPGCPGKEAVKQVLACSEYIMFAVFCRPRQ